MSDNGAEVVNLSAPQQWHTNLDLTADSTLSHVYSVFSFLLLFYKTTIVTEIQTDVFDKNLVTVVSFTFVFIVFECLHHSFSHILLLRFYLPFCSPSRSVVLTDSNQKSPRKSFIIWRNSGSIVFPPNQVSSISISWIIVRFTDLKSTLDLPCLLLSSISVSIFIPLSPFSLFSSYFIFILLHLSLSLFLFIIYFITFSSLPSFTNPILSLSLH